MKNHLTALTIVSPVTAVFLIIGGCSTLISLLFIVPPIVAGTPMEIIEIYTTEPAFAIDCIGIACRKTYAKNCAKRTK